MEKVYANFMMVQYTKEIGLTVNSMEQDDISTKQVITILVNDPIIRCRGKVN
jgi:hypothetical protein